MRKLFLILAVLAALAIAAPVYAQDEYDWAGTFSIGLGYGFGDDTEVGPMMLSGKYWAPQWEVGAEVYYDGDTEDESDQIGMAWLAYRMNLDELGTYYAGVGPAFAFETNGFANDIGGVVFVGYDDIQYGAQVKYAYFDPSVISIVVYYNFPEEGY